MIKGAIFDVDGTLLDSMYIWNDIGYQFLNKYNVEPEPDFLNIIAAKTLNNFAEYVIDKYGIKKHPEKIVDEVVELVDDFYANKVQLKKGVAEFLDCLAVNNVDMVIATSSDKSYLLKAFSRLGIDKYFSDIYTCRDYHTTKTLPDIYLKSAENFKCSKNEIYVFEDVLHAVKTAKNAGFKVVAVEDKESLAQKDEIKRIADMYISDFCELDIKNL